MIKELDLRVAPHIAYDNLTLSTHISTMMNVDVNRINSCQLIKRSIDARQRQVFVNLKVRVFIDEQPLKSLVVPVEYQSVSGQPKVIVVGAGPAGLFAALRLIELGLRPIVLERGKDVAQRKVDMARISRENIVDPDSNYCFGEGGAGAFSDGKLYTRSKKRGSVDKILNIFCQHGASEDILVDAHPHIGTDKLPGVIKAMRETILRCGGEVRFSTRVIDLIVENNSVVGVKSHRDEEFRGPVILATGHSARDIYMMLKRRNVQLQPKGIAVGVRLEHPQKLIDCIQYH